MAGNGFPRVSRRGYRGSQEDHGQNDKNGRKWLKMDFRGKMVGNGFPRENGRKWIAARFASFPYYFDIYYLSWESMGKKCIAV